MESTTSEVAVPRHTLFGTATDNLQKEVCSNSSRPSTYFLQHGVHSGSETLSSSYLMIIESSFQWHQNDRSTSWLQPLSAVQVGSGDSAPRWQRKNSGASDASQQVMRVQAFAYVFTVLRQRYVIVPRGRVNPCNKQRDNSNKLVYSSLTDILYLQLIAYRVAE